MFISLAARYALYALLYALQGNSRWPARWMRLCGCGCGCGDGSGAATGFSRDHSYSCNACTASGCCSPRCAARCSRGTRCGLAFGRVCVSALYGAVFLIPTVWWMVDAAYRPLPPYASAFAYSFSYPTAYNDVTGTNANAYPNTTASEHICTSTSDPLFAQCLRYWLAGSTSVNEWLLWCFTFVSVAQALLYTCLSALIPDRPPTRAAVQHLRVAALVVTVAEEARKEAAKAAVKAAAARYAQVLDVAIGAAHAHGHAQPPAVAAVAAERNSAGADEAAVAAAGGGTSVCACGVANGAVAEAASMSAAVVLIRTREAALESAVMGVECAAPGYDTAFPLADVDSEDDEPADRARKAVPCGFRLRRAARASTSARRVVAALYAAFSLMSASDLDSAVYRWGWSGVSRVCQVLFYDALTYDVLMIVDEIGGKRARQLRSIYTPLRRRLYPTNPRVWSAHFADANEHTHACTHVAIGVDASASGGDSKPKPTASDVDPHFSGPDLAMARRTALPPPFAPALHMHAAGPAWSAAAGDANSRAPPAVVDADRDVTRTAPLNSAAPDRGSAGAAGAGVHRSAFDDIDRERKRG